MALTTQCPSCQTTFRVASDQLKLRAGLVRCGACNEVFDGNAHLLANLGLPPLPPAYLASEAHAVLPEPEASRVAGIDDIVVEAGAELASGSEEQKTDVDAEPGKALVAEAESEPSVQPEFEAKTDTVTESLPQSFAQARSGMNAEHLPRALKDMEGKDEEAPDARSEADLEEPGFVLRARRAERSNRALRLFLWFGCSALFFALIAQGAYSCRNYLAAYLPQSQPYLQRICATLGCKLELLTQIDAIAIEATELQQSSMLKDTLVLTTLLRNRSTVTQAWPNIELSLNDANEKVVVRRVFTATDYLPQPKEAAKGIAANTEQSIKLVFEVTQLKPSGYRLYLFYP
jgi:predicted Zn finger-like uncharacterized protein